MENTNDTQDVNLEKNEESDSQEKTEETKESNEPSALEKRVEELAGKVETQESEISKYKRLLAKKDKKTSSKTSDKKDPSQSDDNDLLNKTFLRAAGITDKDEVSLALETAEKWNVDVDELVDDPDFQLKLERLKTEKSNELASTDIKGGQGKTSKAKETAAYWQQKGTPPTREDVPDRKTRSKIIREMMASGKDNKKFYND